MSNLDDLEALLKKSLLLVDQLREKSNEVNFESQDIQAMSVNSELLSLVLKDEWPSAVSQKLICNESVEEDKLERAEYILHLVMDVDLKDKKFLDFGCGEGHVAVKAAQSAALSVGYDIVQTGNLEWDQTPLLTTDLSKVKELGLFDVILLYDVLDHCEDPIAVMRTVYSLLAIDGKVILRCHPWCSRHGSHQYKVLNKAFIHLIFNTEELAQLGFVDDSKQRITRPLDNYKTFFAKSGFKVDNFIKEVGAVEDFFIQNKEIKNRLMKSLNLESWTIFQLEQTFIDFYLTKI